MGWRQPDGALRDPLRALRALAGTRARRGRPCWRVRARHRAGGAREPPGSRRRRRSLGLLHRRPLRQSCRLRERGRSALVIGLLAVRGARVATPGGAAPARHPDLLGGPARRARADGPEPRLAVRPPRRGGDLPGRHAAPGAHVAHPAPHRGRRGGDDPRGARRLRQGRAGTGAVDGLGGAGDPDRGSPLRAGCSGRRGGRPEGQGLPGWRPPARGGAARGRRRSGGGGDRRLRGRARQSVHGHRSRLEPVQDEGDPARRGDAARAARVRPLRLLARRAAALRARTARGDRGRQLPGGLPPPREEPGAAALPAQRGAPDALADRDRGRAAVDRGLRNGARRGRPGPSAPSWLGGRPDGRLGPGGPTRLS